MDNRFNTANNPSMAASADRLHQDLDMEVQDESGPLSERSAY